MSNPEPILRRVITCTPHDPHPLGYLRLYESRLPEVDATLECGHRYHGQPPEPTTFGRPEVLPCATCEALRDGKKFHRYSLRERVVQVESWNPDAGAPQTEERELSRQEIDRLTFRGAPWGPSPPTRSQMNSWSGIKSS